jgi:hypothetical protein
MTASNPDGSAGAADSSGTGGGASSSGSSSNNHNSEMRSAYSDLRRLIPQLAAELDQLRAALREHNLWLQRYGHSASSSQQQPDPYAPPTTNSTGPAGGADSELPGYSASDVPPYRGTGNSVSASTQEEVEARRDQLIEWLGEGEDTLREYSTRFAQLADELSMPPEDVLGTWNEASPDNALPDYERVETREELMVGGVGEVPPPYVRGQALEKANLG